MAALFSAYTGAVLQQERLPGPVTHVQAVGEDSAARRIFLMANVAPPFGDSADVFAFPLRAALPATPVHLWAADKATGALCVPAGRFHPTAVRFRTLAASRTRGASQHCAATRNAS